MVSQSRSFTAMILCDRKELIGQANDKINSLGLFPTVIAPKYRQTINRIYLASVDTLRRRDFPKIDLLIVDEAHKQTFDKTILKYQQLCNPYIIGATATPLRTGNQNCLSTMYSAMVDPVSIQDLIDNKFLVDARTYAAKEDFSKVKTRGADFDSRALFEKFNDSKLYDGVVDNYKKFSENEKAICFNVNVEHSRLMTDKFKDSGISAAHIDGNTSDWERKQILRDYKEGKFNVLSNCSVLTTGFDEPSIKTVIVNRATMSLSLWLQMCGRGSRPFDQKEGFKIIDQGANVYRHGMWEEDREWSLVKKKKRKSDGVAPVKICLPCGAINYASATKCKICDSPFPEKEKKLHKGEFVEVEKKYTRGAISKPDPKTATAKELHEYAKMKGYRPGWVYKQMEIHGRN